MQTELLVPYNPTTGRAYNGRNHAMLVQAMIDHEYGPHFATFRQWLTVGRCVRGKQKSVGRIVKFRDIATKNDQGELGRETRPCRGASVFALEQTEEMPEDKKPDEVSELQAVDLSTIREATETAGQAEAKPREQAKLNIAMLERKADSLEAKAEACHADRPQNTAKRLGQAMRKRLEGNQLLRQAAMLRAVVEHGAPSELQFPSARDIISASAEASLYTTEPVPNGYHGYECETDTPQHSDPHHCALRALLSPETTAQAAKDMVKIQAEAELRNRQIPGFFPTPITIAEAMLAYFAPFNREQLILEPSCGKGDLVDAINDHGEPLAVDCVECVPALASYTRNNTRARTVICEDFLAESEPRPIYHGVLMNPPYEQHQAPKHVAHALKFLRQGGQLVALMPANWSDDKASAPILEAHEAGLFTLTRSAVIAGGFSKSDSFRQTGVSVQIIAMVRKFTE